jgi:hypothetical protein
MSDKEITLEAVYFLLKENNALLLEQKQTIDELRELLSKVPEAMSALNSSPMFKPFAKMLGL